MYEAAKFCLAQIMGLHIATHAEEPDNFIQDYQDRWARICEIERFVFISFHELFGMWVLYL